MAQKLLLADDSVTIQRVIELTFADENIQVIAVGDGQRAIEVIERERPDIVLADIGMPGKSGYEVAAFVKGHSSLAHIPVLLLTGAFEPVDEARARAIGCDGILVKPFEPQVVIHRVRELLAGRRPRELWTTPLEAASSPGAPSPSPRAEPISSPAELAQSETKMSAGGREPSLEEYFDRLDAAFTGLGAGAPPLAPPTPPPAALQPEPPAEPPGTHGRVSIEEELARWDEIGPAGDAGPAAPVERPAPASAADAPSPTAGLASPPPLADVFAALLAAEERGATAAAPLGLLAGEGMVVTDDLVEQVAKRVLERMTDRVIRETVSELVLQVAERLVREEIERLKASVS